jgi:hypothetical protein
MGSVDMGVEAVEAVEASVDIEGGVERAWEGVRELESDGKMTNFTRKKLFIQIRKIFNVT